MAGPTLDSLLKMLGTGRDNALLRFSLGNEYWKKGDASAAVHHLRAAVAHDREYSAAWKLLGRALEASGAFLDAREAYREGVQVAEVRGDKQAAREMEVFARRLDRKLAQTLDSSARDVSSDR